MRYNAPRSRVKLLMKVKPSPSTGSGRTSERDFTVRGELVEPPFETASRHHPSGSLRS
uniref:Uncharacterized protein n=1 Tax=uncultured marine microorganism HF4000_010I05 TaxID=455517 RepID=B3T1M2_9ZZZZ|nr:hypothetical protein ALOHA_HF4000010I05ctg1g46 [uncultured marine microorganism HF4000_010I05]